MSTLLEELQVTGELKALWDLRRGSLLDWSWNGNLLTVVSSPLWQRTRRGLSSYTDNSATHYLTPGNPASLQLSTMTMFAVAARTFSVPGNYQCFMAKHNCMSLYSCWPAAEPRFLGSYDYSFGWRNSTFSQNADSIARLYAISGVSGLANGLLFYVNGAPYGTSQFTLVNQASAWAIGGSAQANQGLGGQVLLAGVINRVLTPAEHARLYTDWQSEIILPAPPNRITYSYPSKRASEYTAAGIVLDTDFGSEVSAGTRRIREFTGAYPGTITGVAMPGKEGNGIALPGPPGQDSLSFGDLAHLNSTASFSIEQVLDIPPGTIADVSVSYKYANAGNNIALGPSIGGAVAAKGWTAFVSNVNPFTYGTTTAPGYIRAGTREHVVTSLKGLGATDPDKLKVYVGGEQATLTIVGPIPAATGNLATYPWKYGYQVAVNAATKMGFISERHHTAALTPAQVRSSYLNFAHQIVWQYSGEDVPVSLVASVAAAQYIGRWRGVSGTQKCSESSEGRRWLEGVTAGCRVLPQPFAVGMTTFTVSKAMDAGTMAIMFVAAMPLAWTTATQNGYALVIDANAAVSLQVITNGVSVSTLMQTANGYIAFFTAYTFAIARRKSDGQFTVWIKGGAYADWTLLSVVGGAGANPAVDATYFASAWMSVNLDVGDKLMLFDPRASGIVGEYL